MSGRLLAIAHRAGNSLTRLTEAVTLGADVIEADVHLYRGSLEIRHLKTAGPLPFLWDQWELRSARAPRLGLEALLEKSVPAVPLMLDLKGESAAIGTRVAQVLRDRAPGVPVLVCSRYWPALRPLNGTDWVRVVRSARTRAEFTALLKTFEQVDDEKPVGASVHLSLLDSHNVAILHRHLEVVMTWPVNTEAALTRVRKLSATGTIGVITDETAILRRVISSR